MSYRHKKPLDLDQRAKATAAVLAVWRPRAFDWAAGHHCIALAHAQARAMGHAVPALPVLRGPIAARRALDRMGHADVTALLDSQFHRIAPAFARVGDLCVLPAEPGTGGEVGLDAVAIADGLGNLFGWHADDDRGGMSTVTLVQGQVAAAFRLGEAAA